MPRIVAEIDADLKKWLQWQALATESTMGKLVCEALEDYREKIGEVTPPNLPTPKGKK